MRSIFSAQRYVAALWFGAGSAEKIEEAPRQPREIPRKRAAYETDVPTFFRLLERYRAGYFPCTRQRRGRKKRVVLRVEDERRRLDVLQARLAARPSPVVVGIQKPVQRRGDDVV